MIVKGKLSYLGSGVVNSTTGFTAYNSIGFENGQELMVDQSTRIAVPQYLADKLTRLIGKDIELSLTNNKQLLVAVKADGQVYRIDGIKSWMCTTASSGVGKMLVMMGWVTIVFPPLFVLYLIFAALIKSQIVSAAKVFD